MIDYEGKEFSKNDQYLIEENYRNGNDDFFMLFAGDKRFVVPYMYTEGNNTYRQAVARFENHLFDVEDAEIEKYVRNHKRIKKVKYDDRDYIVPFSLRDKEVKASEIAEMWLNKVEAKYNMIVNAHRDLFENDFEVAPVMMSSRNANEYAKILEENGMPVVIDEKTPEMIKVVKFFDKLEKDAKIIKGTVKKKGEKALEKGEKKISKILKQAGEVIDGAKDEFVDEIEGVVVGLKKGVKKKIVETEYGAVKKFITKNYKIALLAGAIGIAGGGAGYLANKYNEKNDSKKDKIETVTEIKKYKVVQDGVYTTYKGKRIQDKFGNLETINNLREEITTMMVAVEGYTNGGFGDTRGNPTVGIGMTYLYDDKGVESKVTSNTVLSDRDIIIQKWRYMEENMLPIIASIDRKCSKEELMATLGAGFCWGPTNLRRSDYLAGLKNGESVDKLSRKLTGFRAPIGLLKREYLLANVLEGKWNENDLKDMPVYYIKNKGFLHCAIYTLEFEDICKVRRNKKGEAILDENKNQIPVKESDNFCTLFIEKSDEILDKLVTPNPKFGDYKTVSELIPDDIKECFKPDFCLSKLQEEKALLNGDGKSIHFNQVLAMNNVRD